MTSATPQAPFVVSVVFSDGKTHYHDLVWIMATDMITAGAAATGAYYFNGGKLPLYSIRVGCKVARLAPRSYEGDHHEYEPPAG